MSVYSLKPFIFEKCDGKPLLGKSFGPQPRSGHRIGYFNGSLYAFGGYNPCENLDMPPNDLLWAESKPLFKELWMYNFASKLWKKLPCQGTIPDELVSNAIIITDSGTMIIYGGTSVPFGQTCSNRLHLCDLRDDVNAIELVDACGNLPTPLYGQAISLVGSYLYAIGGTTGFEYCADVHRFCFQTRKWEEVYICSGNTIIEPEGRYRHELAFDGTKLYLLGGGTSTDVFGFQEMWTFNLNLSRWEKLSAFPDPLAPLPGFPASRRCHSAVQMERNEVYISGGCNSIEAFDDVWKLDLDKLQWTHLAKCKLSSPVYFHSATLTPSGRMICFGGVEKKDDTEKRSADIQVVWLCLPKLSALCWEAVIHYSPSLNLLSKNQLLQQGIPLKFVNQLQT